MLQQKETKFLCFGDRVVFRGKLAGQLQGYLSSIGFIDDRILLQKVGATPNLSDLIFQIHPKIYFTVQEEYDEYLRHPSPHPSQAQLAKFEEKLALERLNNANIVANHNGKRVNYGDLLCFFHVKSKSYVSVLMLASQVEKSGLQMKVTRKLSKDIFFKIMSLYKLRTEGKPIPFGDDVIVFSPSFNMQLNFRTEGLHEFDIPKLNSQADKKPLCFPLLKNKATRLLSRYEVYMSQGTETEWRLFEYSKFNPESNPRELRLGELFMLKHTESEAFLSSGFKLAAKDKGIPVYLKKYKEPSREFVSLQDFWELISVSHPISGECARSNENECYFLRHYTTGRIVSIGNLNIGGKRMKTLELKKEDGCRLKVTSIEPEAVDKPINTAFNYCLQFLESTSKQTVVQTEVELKNYGRKVPNFYEPPKEKDLQSEKFLLELQPCTTISAKNAFQFIKVSTEEKKVAEFVLALKQYLWRFLKFIRNSANTRFQLNEIEKIKRILEAGIKFLVRDKSPKVDLQALKEKSPHPLRQFFMKEAGIIDIVACINHYSFDNKKVSFLEELGGEARAMFNELYLLLNLAIREQRACEIYSSRWLELFIYQTKEESEKNELWAEFTLTELLDNNYYLLTEGIQRESGPSLAAVFVQLLRQNRKAKYLKLLTALVNCEGKPVIRNQEDLIKLMFAAPEKTITVKAGPRTLEVECDFSYIAIEEVQEEADLRYYQEYFRLLSNMCLDKNYQAINRLKSYVPLEPAVRLLFNPELDHRLRCSLFGLVLNLWVDSLHCHLQLPDYLRSVSALRLEEDTEDYLRYNHLNDYEPFKRELMAHLRESVLKREKAQLQPEELLVLTKMFETVSLFLKYGLFSEKGEVVLVVEILYKFLNVCNFRMREQGPECEEQLNKCRKLVCQILLQVKSHEIEVFSTRALAAMKDQGSFTPDLPALIELLGLADKQPLCRQVGRSYRLSVLCSLLTTPNSPQLNWCSFELMVKELQGASFMFEYLQQVRLIEEVNGPVYSLFIELSQSLTYYSDIAENWYGKQEGEEVMQQVLDLLGRVLGLVLEDGRPNTEFQHNFRVLGLEEKVLKILQLDVEVSEQLEEARLSEKVLAKAYEVLRAYCQGNQANKMVLFKYRAEFRTHFMKARRELGAHLLVAELFLDNSELLYDLDVVLQTAQDTCELLQSLEPAKAEHLPYRRQLFAILHALMEENGKCIAANQATCLSNFCLNKYNNLLTYWRGLKLAVPQVKAFETGLADMLGKGRQGELQVPPRLQVFLMTLKFLINTSKDLNDITQKKLKCYLSEQQILQLVNGNRGNYPLVRELFFFYLEVYVITEDLSFESIRIRMEIFDIAFNEFVRVLQHFGGALPAQEAYVRLGGERVQLSDLLVDYAFNILAVLISKLSKFYEGLSMDLSRGFQPLKRVLDDHPEYFVDRGLNLKVQAFVECLGDSVDKSRFETVVQGIKDSLQRTLERKASEMMLREAKSLSVLYHQNLAQVGEEQEFKEYLLGRQWELIRRLRASARTSQLVFRGEKAIDFREVVRAIVLILRPENQKMNDRSFFIEALRLLRGMVESENRGCGKEVDEWETEDWAENKHRVVAAQNMLCQAGALQSIFLIISDAELPKEVLVEVVKTLIAMLIGGNAEVQRQIYRILTQDEGGRILQPISAALNSSFEYLSSVYDEVDKLLFLRENDSHAVDKFLGEKEDYALNKEAFLLLMRVLQLCCEGHNASMQHFLRAQTSSNNRGINFIQFTCAKIRVFMRFFSKYSIEIGEKLFEFLIESIQGPCIENQVEGIKSKVVEGVRELFASLSREEDYSTRGFLSPEERAQASGLLSSGAMLLLALTEGHLNHEVFFNIHSSINYSEFSSGLLLEYRWLLDELGLPEDQPLDSVLAKMADRYDQLPDRLLEVFNIYLLFCYIDYENAMFREDSPQEAAEVDPSYAPLRRILTCDVGKEPDNAALRFYRRLTRSIEVKIDETLKKVFFPLNPASGFLSPDSKDEFMTNVNRTSGSEKVSGLMLKTHEFCFEADHLRRLSGLPVSITIPRMQLLEYVNILIAIAINLVALADIKLDAFVSPAGSNNYRIVGNEQGELAYRVLSIIQIVVYAFMILCWLFIYGPLQESRSWTKLMQASKSQLKPELEEALARASHPSELSLAEVTYALNLRGPEDSLWRVGKERDFGSNYGRAYYLYRKVSFVLGNMDLLLNFVWLSCSVAGLLSGYPDGLIFYTFQLLWLVRKVQIFRNVIRSITTNVGSLLISYLVGTILLYMLAMIAFYYFASDSFMGFQFFDELTCSTLLLCTFNLHYMGLVNGGGVADFFRLVSLKSEEHYYVRGVYDFVFFFLVQVIFLNLFFGIVIDTFAQLRDARNQVAMDTTNKCFVCNINRLKFEKYTDGFEKHIRNEHYAWDYVWYLYYLLLKDETEHTGIESIIHRLYRSKEVSWFPVMRSISLEKKLGDQVEDEGE